MSGPWISWIVIAFVGMLTSGVVAQQESAPATTASEQASEVVELWPDAAPDEPGNLGAEYVRMSPSLSSDKVEVTTPTRMITNVTRPTLTIYRPSKPRQPTTSVIICPGGGYWDLYWELEGEEVARWLASRGMVGIILKYRVPRRPGEVEAEPAKRPLQDAQRAVRLVRSNAAAWQLDPERIGLIGFSAGGHLALATATGFERRTYEPMDAVDELSCRPNFAAGIYSGYLKAKDKLEVAADFDFPERTPPIFLVHGSIDPISPPSHSVVMYLALQQAQVPVELHVYANTTHDFGVRQADRPYAEWTATWERWLIDQKLLSR